MATSTFWTLCFETRAVRAIAFCGRPFTDLSLRTSLVLSFSPFGTSSFSGLHGSPSVTGMAGDVYWRCRTAIFGWVDGGADAQYRWCRKGLGLTSSPLSIQMTIYSETPQSNYASERILLRQFDNERTFDSRASPHHRDHSSITVPGLRH